jgi:hypothetical protein
MKLLSRTFDLELLSKFDYIQCTYQNQSSMEYYGEEIKAVATISG